MSSYSSPYYTSNVRDTMSQSKFLTGKAAFTPAELAGIASGELEARYAGEAKNRQTLLQERQQEAQEKSTAWNQSYYEKQMASKEEADKKQAQANTISGVGQVVTGGVGLYATGKQAGLWGATTPGTGLTSSGLAGAGSTAAATAAGEGAMTGAGYSLTSTGIYGAGGSTTYTGASAPTLSGAGGATLGTVAGSAGAAYAVGSLAGAAAGKMADWKVSHQVYKSLTGGLIKGEKTEKRMGGAGAGMGAGALAGSMILPGIGTVVGAVVGAAAGYISSGESVICTELNRQGLLPDKVLEYDSMYGNSIDKEAYYGYRLWADKVVKLMQKSKLFTKIVKPFGLAFAYESAHRINPEIKGNLLGKLMLFAGVPMCKLIYRLKQSRKEFCNGLSWSIR